MSQRHGAKRIGYRPKSRSSDGKLPPRSSIYIEADLFMVFVGESGSEAAAVKQIQEWAAQCHEKLENRRSEFVPSDGPLSVSRQVNRIILRRVIRYDLISHLLN